MANALYTQRATGQVTLPIVPATCHCGIDDNLLNLSYSICLVWQCDSLDSSGFLLDNLTFSHYWAARASTPLAVSCELLCKQCCHDMLELGGSRMVSCSVEIVPFSGVSVEYSCTV